MITGAIFDVDGVLLDSMGMWEKVGAEYLMRQGKTPAPDLPEVLSTMYLLGAAEYMRVNYELPWTCQEILQQIVDMMEEYYTHVVLPKEGVRDFLKSLKERQIMVTVATAGDRKLAMAGLESGGLLSFIDEIFTCAEMGAGKENPAVYQAAWRRMGTELTSTWVFEDSLHGILTAKKAGFSTVGIYDKSSEKNWEELKKHSTYYLEDFRQWERFFEMAVGERLK